MIERRLMDLHVTRRHLSLLLAGQERYVDLLPADVRVVEIIAPAIDSAIDAPWSLRLYSRRFEPVVDGAPIPVYKGRVTPSERRGAIDE
jgi:hypothetical protein